MNHFADSFARLQQARNRATGKNVTVKINGKSYPAIIGEITCNESKEGGGESDIGGGAVDIATALHRKEPEGEIEVHGRLWDILSCVDANGVTWTITFGEKAAQ